MSTLKVPSLQHLARIWRDDPEHIKRVLIGLVKSGPTFSYEPLHVAVRDMLVLGVPAEQVAEGIRRHVKRQDVRQNFLGLLPLIQNHFEGVRAKFVMAVAPRFYPVSRELMVPFYPPLIYGANGEIHFPWLSFWRSNPLAGERLSLFVSMVEEVLLQDPDLEDAKFKILDFSAPDSKSDRELKIVDVKEVPRLSHERRKKMLTIFAEGYRLAHDAKKESDHQEKLDSEESRSQIKLF